MLARDHSSVGVLDQREMFSVHCKATVGALFVRRSCQELDLKIHCRQRFKSRHPKQYCVYDPILTLCNDNQ